MKTVKEISHLTGISVRALHYYDEIELLKPTAKSETGYRLYDDKALERLRQILFFREFDLPLKEIRAVMENPSFDRNGILQMQRRMLMRKKELFISYYGSEEEWRRQFLDNAASEKAQKNYAKVIEWYGSKEKAMDAQKNATGAGLVTAYQKRIAAVMQNAQT